MEDIGKLLTETRQQLGKTHEEVHEETKVTVQHIKYLEENNFNFLPETYVKSYLRSYATALGLNGDDLVNKYTENRKEEARRQAAQAKEEEVIPQPSELKTQLMEWGVGFGFFVLLFCLIFAYVEYRAQVDVSAQEFFVDRASTEKTALAEIDFHTLTPEEPAAHAFELEITALENVWIQLTIDSKQVSEVTLTPEQKFKWAAEHRIDVVIGQPEAGKAAPDSNSMKSQRSQKKIIRFSLTKNGLKSED